MAPNGRVFARVVFPKPCGCFASQRPGCPGRPKRVSPRQWLRHGRGDDAALPASRGFRTFAWGAGGACTASGRAGFCARYVLERIPGGRGSVPRPPGLRSRSFLPASGGFCATSWGACSVCSAGGRAIFCGCHGPACGSGPWGFVLPRAPDPQPRPTASPAFLPRK